MKPLAARPAPLRSAPPDEAALLEGCRRGDRVAQAELYRAYRPHVMRIVQRVLGPQRDLIEDVVQDVFIAAFRAIVGFRGDSRLTTWLYRVSVNVSLQWLARRRRGEVTVGGEGELPDLPDHLTPDRAAQSRAELKAIYRILDRMSDKKRLVFVLHEIEQLEPREIAAITGAPEVTVRTRLHYARKEFFERASRDPAFGGAEGPGQRSQGSQGSQGSVVQ